MRYNLLSVPFGEIFRDLDVSIATPLRQGVVGGLRFEGGEQGVYGSVRKMGWGIPIAYSKY